MHGAPRPERLRRTASVVVIVPRWTLQVRPVEGVELATVERGRRLQDVLERRRPRRPVVPALVVGDPRDEPLAEVLPVARPGAAERDGETERAPLPGRREDDLAVVARRRDRPFEVGVDQLGIGGERLRDADHCVAGDELL